MDGEQERERNGGLEKEHKGVYEREGDRECAFNCEMRCLSSRV